MYWGQTRCSNSGDQFQRMPVLEQLVMLSKTRGGGQHRQGADNDVLGNYSGSLVSLFLVESIIFIICKELSSVPTGRMLET